MISVLPRIDQPIDYVGQAYSVKLMYIIFAIGYAVALITGLVKSDLRYTLVLGIATCAVAFTAAVPSWPYLRRNPLRFKARAKAKEE